MFGVEPDDVTPAMRSKVKAMSYGLAYGLSAFGLSKQLTISTEEAGSARRKDRGRTVGIVSHVEELKSQIPDQIRIRRSPAGGSTLAVTT